jgi:hypothetical protein
MQDADQGAAAGGGGEAAAVAGVCLVRARGRCCGLQGCCDGSSLAYGCGTVRVHALLAAAAAQLASTAAVGCGICFWRRIACHSSILYCMVVCHHCMWSATYASTVGWFCS